MAQPEIRMRWVRNIATNKVTCQSSNQTRRLLKQGGYAEVAPPDGAPALPPLKAPSPKAPSGRVLLYFALGCFALAAVVIWLMVAKSKGLF